MVNYDLPKSYTHDSLDCNLNVRVRIIILPTQIIVVFYRESANFNEYSREGNANGAQ